MFNKVIYNGTVSYIPIINNNLFRYGISVSLAKEILNSNFLHKGIYDPFSVLSGQYKFMARLGI